MRPAEEVELRERLRTDTPFWAEQVAKIVSVERRLVPLVPYPWQLELDAILEGQRSAGMPMRAIILKARKLGFSTWVQAKFLQRLTQMPYQNAVVVAQDVKTAGVLFEMARIMHAHLPTQLELGVTDWSIKPAIVAKSFSPQGRKFMQFGEPSRRLRDEGRGIECLLEIDTAGTPESGRGYTPSMVHCSEAGRWENVQKLVGLLNAVPDVEESIIVIESTAQGFNHFQKRWQRAVDGLEDEDAGGLFAPYFAAWHRDQRCRQRFLSPEARERFKESIGTGPYGDEEPLLVEQFGCSPEQLLWRRSTIREKCEDSIEFFHQEYPATPEQAFIGSGQPVFGGILVAKAFKAAQEAPAPVRGALEGDEWWERRTRGGSVLLPKKVLWVPAEVAGEKLERVGVWAHPVNKATQEGVLEVKPDGQYVCTVDVAEGVATGDYHSIQVRDHVTRDQVLEWRGKIDVDDLKMLVYLVGLYYNTALIAVETTGGYGLPVADWLRKDARYPRLYRRKIVGHTREVEEEKVGWDTNKQTKPLMESALRSALKDDTHGIRSLPLARELSVYVEDDKGRHGAMQGENDDLLSAYMVGERIMDIVKPRGEKRASRRVRGHTVQDDAMGY